MAETKEVNLFSDDVVIIIGAGASVPFGLPTGLDLIDLIHAQLEKEENLISNPQGYNSNDTPLFQASNLAGCERTSAKWIASQASDSIDDLIRHNPKYSTNLKQGIALELLKATSNVVSVQNAYFYGSVTKFLPKDFTARKFPLIINGKPKLDTSNKPIQLRNWVHNLINIIRNQITSGVYTSGQKVKIISFNYDGILEAILDKMWTDSELINDDWKTYINIVHPHGLVDNITNELMANQVPDLIKSNAEKIAIIHDTSSSLSPEIQSWRETAKGFVENSKYIYSIGFAFAKSNCDYILGMSDRWAKGDREIHYINFDGNVGLDARVMRFETGRDHLPVSKYEHGSHLHPMAPIKGDYLQITDALMGGFLGEMPS